MNYVVIKNGSDFLIHHGIKGQKWGIRRFQNEDGSLTVAGEKRYNSSDYKQSHRDKLINNYITRGYTEAEAEEAAKKRIITEKVLVAVGATTVAAAAAYVAYKHYDKTVDKIIKSNTTLHNISIDPNKGIVNKPFYAAINKADRRKYRGVFGGFQLGGNKGTKIYDTSIGITKDLKLASEKNAKKVLSRLVNDDPSYKNYIKNVIKKASESQIELGDEKKSKMLKKAYKSLLANKIDDNVYDAVNFLLVDHSSAEQNMANKKFYDYLMKAGYDAIRDTHDLKYSGYNAKSAVITFNTGKTYVKNRMQVPIDLMKKDFNYEKNKVIGKEFIKRSLIAISQTGAPVYLGIAGITAPISIASNTKVNDSFVKKYRVDHPESNLSYKEIVALKK